MSRPTQQCDAVIRKCAEAELPDFKAWIDSDNGVSDARLLDDLYFALRYCGDGYSKAKALENRGYSPDAKLVEFLDNMDLWGAERAAVAEWVTQFDVKAPFPVGTKVNSPHGEGEITKHDEKLGLATICIESLGHVREGIGTHGYLVPWEKLTISK